MSNQNRFERNFCHLVLYFNLLCSVITLSEAKGRGGGGYRGYYGGGSGGVDSVLLGILEILGWICVGVLVIFFLGCCCSLSGLVDIEDTNECNPNDEWKSPAKYYPVSNEDIDLEGKIQTEELHESELIEKKRLQEEKEQEERMKELEPFLEG